MEDKKLSMISPIEESMEEVPERQKGEKWVGEYRRNKARSLLRRPVNRVITS